MTPEEISRAHALADLHADVMVALRAAAAGYPERLIRAKWKGTLDTGIACLIRDIQTQRPPVVTGP